MLTIESFLLKLTVLLPPVQAQINLQFYLVVYIVLLLLVSVS